MNDTSPPIGHNLLAAQHDEDRLPGLLREAQELGKVVDTWIKECPEIGNAEQATHARDLLAKLNDFRKAVEEERTTKKRPHLDAAKAVDAAYQPIAALLIACVAPINGLLSVWAKKEQNRIDAEKRAAREEAERLAREAEAMARKAQATPTVSDTIAAATLEKRAREAEAAARKAEAARPRIESAIGARAAAPRVTWFAKLTNFPLACRHYKDHPDVVEVLERLASAEARKGVRELPGFKIDSRESIA